MKKTILLTGATDGIGLETAKMLLPTGHTLLLHGRNPDKLQNTITELSALSEGTDIEGYVADLSSMTQVQDLAKAVTEKNNKVDILINNAGIYSTPTPRTGDGLDIRFAVNTIAPYILTTKLLPLIGQSGRVVNVSSAAQFPVDLDTLVGRGDVSDGAAYAQSQLALIMWSRHLALTLGEDGPMILSVNPRSMLGSKMVQQAYGVKGADLQIGADILCRAALDEAFEKASGLYFDNDIGNFSSPHPDALNPQKCSEVVRVIDATLATLV